MKYVFFDHQGKGQRYIRELNSRYERIELGDEVPGFVFTDSDLRGRRAQLETLKARGVGKFFMYPHSARPNLVNDIQPAWDGITAHFVATRWHRNIMLGYGYPNPVIDVGWSLCEQNDFVQRRYLRNVLFAPIHHRCAEIDKLANREAHERLVVLAKAGEIVLTVRHYKGIETTGIQPVKHEAIHYVEAGLQPETDAIDMADVVVAHQTFLYLAVARGIPAVGFGTWVPCHIVPGDEVHYAKSWHSYVKELAFPLDIAFEDPLDVLWTALEGSDEAESWRRRMIGPDFDRQRFLDAMDEFLR